MGACLHIIGLGPGGLDQMTIGNFRLLKSARKIFVRTSQHPCVQDLVDSGLVIETFDNIYNSENSFEDVYEKIVDRIRQEMAPGAEVVYAVPGHPSVAEKTVTIIFQKLSGQHKIIIHSALSFLDGIFAAVPFDPVEGLLVKNYDELKNSGITGREWLIVLQIYNRMIASDVKLDLMEIYPENLEVIIIQSLGTGEQKLQKVLLYELDHYKFDHLTTVVIPPCQGVVSLVKLQELMRTLRSPEGCPWDREQTHESLIPFLIEESYEVVEAINNKDMNNLAEELGDLLLQIVFHTQLAAEVNNFQMEDVLHGIISKLIRRHPHVFSERKATSSSEVIETWKQIKQEEKDSQKDQEPNCFPGAQGLPALLFADRIQRKAAKLGFDWPDMKGPLIKIQEELRELENALEHNEGVREEFGDLLFSIVNLARFLEFDAEEVLRDAVRKFQKRFLIMQELALDSGTNFTELSLNDMDSLWEKAKSEEKKAKVVMECP
ncbi:MAG TPA: nucleoside triphosphate pyrophosphohydrolase [Desulfitobacteriaceae bacterium]|nr:nucleoside triphosphate pyrophosphohydrolase [Desulfitobacteriaceae bacterium]